MKATAPAGGDVWQGGEVVTSFEDIGVLAFTTGRTGGSFGLLSDEPSRDVIGRWTALRGVFGGSAARLATSFQVHGARVIRHGGEWRGWLRGEDADGHMSLERGTAMAVLVADCVPVFLAHPRGMSAVLHSGWRGTVAGITARALTEFASLGCPPDEVRMHCGPAICGRCYEVSADIYARLSGRSVDKPTPIDLRLLIAAQARALGVRLISVSPLCTYCDNDRFFSHRAGDLGRQVAVIRASI